MSNPLPQLKEEILRLTREYSKLAHSAQRPGTDTSRAPFIPGGILQIGLLADLGAGVEYFLW